MKVLTKGNQTPITSVVLHRADFLLDPDHKSLGTNPVSCGVVYYLVATTDKEGGSSYARTHFTCSCLQHSRIWWVLTTERPPEQTGLTHVRPCRAPNSSQQKNCTISKSKPNKVLLSHQHPSLCFTVLLRLSVQRNIKAVNTENAFIG